MPGKCCFQDRWLQDKDYKTWVLRDPDKRKAKCGVCAISLNIASMGESALKVHLKSDRDIPTPASWVKSSQGIHTVPGSRKEAEGNRRDDIEEEKKTEIERVKKRQKTPETEAKHLVVEADQLSFQPQEQGSFTLVARSNQLRLTAQDKQDEAFRLERQLSKLQEELKSMTN